MCLFGVVAGASRFTERVRADGIAPRSRHYSQNSQRSQARIDETPAFGYTATDSVTRRAYNLQ